jgi:hypothetical protein
MRTEFGSRWRHLAELVVVFDRPAQRGSFVSLGCLSATVCLFLKKKDFGVSRFRPARVSVTIGRGRPWQISRIPLLYKWSH